MSRLLSLGLVLSVACAAEPEPVPATPDPASFASLPDVPFEQAAFSCCGNDRVRRIISAYLDLQRALGHDDLATAQAQLEALRGVALDAADDASLSSHSQGLARQVAGSVEPLSEPTLDELRDLFVDLSSKAIVLAQANPGGSKPVAVAFCVRTNANWLQGDPQLLNPYLGSLEPSGGSFRR